MFYGQIMLRFLNFIFLLIVSFSCYAILSGSLAPDAIDERLNPVGKVSISGEQVKEEVVIVLDVGASVYENNCKMCHQNGLAGAPKFGDKSAWESRITKGIETLHQHVINGYNAMPARGGCSTCTDEDLLKSIEYMLNAVK
jgi:cytochrome c5